MEELINELLKRIESLEKRVSELEERIETDEQYRRELNGF
jgi:chaperonin cofactor prefoldin